LLAPALAGLIFAVFSRCITEGDRTMNEQARVVGVVRADRRRHDRRRTTFYSLVIGSVVKGRRRGPRRASDSYRYDVDWYDPNLFAVAMGIFLLSCLDAQLTLLLLSAGAVEINGLMAAFLDAGSGIFVNAKLGMTASALIYLVAHSSRRVLAILPVRHVLYAIFAGYFLVFCYQLDMLARFPH
jgi:hypothetical protein